VLSTEKPIAIRFVSCRFYFSAVADDHCAQGIGKFVSVNVNRLCRLAHLKRPSISCAVVKVPD
jgi:hypothetical protein